MRKSPKRETKRTRPRPIPIPSEPTLQATASVILHDAQAEPPVRTSEILVRLPGATDYPTGSGLRPLPRGNIWKEAPEAGAFVVKYSFYPALIVASKKIILYRDYSGGVARLNKRRQSMSSWPIPGAAPFAPEEIEILNRVVGPATPVQRAWLAGFLAGLDAAAAAPGTAVLASAAAPQHCRPGPATCRARAAGRAADHRLRHGVGNSGAPGL